MEERKLNSITIYEAKTGADIRRFWAKLGAYHARDTFPGDEDREELAYFLGEEYRGQIEALRTRERDPLHFLFLRREGEEIGFAMPVIYGSEDGKCFLLEFCVYPRFRGGGTGRDCAGALLAWAKARGMQYAELNCGSDPRRPRFWGRLGLPAQRRGRVGRAPDAPAARGGHPPDGGAFDGAGLAALPSGEQLPPGRGRGAPDGGGEGTAVRRRPGGAHRLLRRQAGRPGGGALQRQPRRLHLRLRGGGEL